MVQVPLSRIRPDAGQHRKHFDEQALRELAASIKANGLLEPIVVRPLPESDKDGHEYEIIAGERRFRAHELLGRQKIKAVVRDLPPTATATLQATENIQREEVSALEEGFACLRLLEEAGKNCDHEEALRRTARRMAWPEARVKARIRLTHLPPEVRDLIQRKHAGKGGLGVKDAEALAWLFYQDEEDLRTALPPGGPDYRQRAGQAEVLARKRARGEMSLGALKAAVAQALCPSGDLFEAAPDGNDQKARQAAQDLANLCAGLERYYRRYIGDDGEVPTKHLTHAAIRRSLTKLQAVSQQHAAVVKALEKREAELSGTKAAATWAGG